jgi:hypothetical protein
VPGPQTFFQEHMTMASYPSPQPVGSVWISNQGLSACEECAVWHGEVFYQYLPQGEFGIDDIPQLPVHPNCRCRLEPVWDLDSTIDEWCDEEKGEPDSSNGDSWGPDWDDGHEAMSEAEEESLGAEAPQPEALKATPVRSAADKGEGDTILGLVFGENGRPWHGGPAYGFHGGGYRQHGRNTHGMSFQEKREVKNKAPKSPIDDMDTEFLHHDNGYDDCGEENKRNSNHDLEACLIAHDLLMVQGLESLPDDPRDWDRHPDQPALSPGEVEYADKYRRWAIWWFKGKIAEYEQRTRDEYERGPTE